MKILQKFLLFILLVPAAAAAENRAEIVYAEGYSFSVINTEGIRTVYEIGYDDVLGLALMPGDSILTEEDTWLEIELKNSGSLIKIAENTTMTLNSLTAGGGGSLDIAYGRIRGKINRLLQGEELWIGGYDTVAGIRGTDFGYELFFDPEKAESQRSTTIYCFDGEVQVLQQKIDPSEIADNDKRIEMKEGITLFEGELVETINGFPNDPLVKIPLDPSYWDFWMTHDFVMSPSDIEMDIPLYQEPEEEVEVVQEEIIEEVEEESILIVEEEEHIVPDPEDLFPQFYETRKNLQTAGGICMSIGMGFATAGFVSYMLNPDENRDMLEVFGGMGGLFMLTGSGISLYSLTMDSPPELSP